MDVLDSCSGPSVGPEVRRLGSGVAVVAVRGEVDAPEAALLEGAVADACAAAADLVVVDLSGVSNFSSRGLAALVIAHDVVTRHGVTLAIATGEGNRRVRRPLEITGLDTVLPVFATVGEALAFPVGGG
ncbi:MAG: STAS domain-containing protein [Pseudonocardiales bacterium]|nr:STAS domain-containing protein [Pseudonocardiales bacterium]